MNVLQIVRDERPDVAPLDARTREALRARLIGESIGHRTEPLVDNDMATLDRDPVGVTRRRYWLSIAAIVLVAAGLAAVIVAVTRPEPSAPAAPEATTPGTGSFADEPDTVPVVESMPDSFTAIAENADAADDSSAATTTSAIAQTGPGVTPLALAQPPDGYELRQAFFGTGPGGRGFVRYGADTHTTQLQLIMRDAPDFFANVRDLGRQTWDVDGHTVYSDGELDGCLHDVCSIGLQWDEHTAISILWVDPNGDALVPGSDQASLLELVPKLVESPQV